MLTLLAADLARTALLTLVHSDSVGVDRRLDARKGEVYFQLREPRRVFWFRIFFDLSTTASDTLLRGLAAHPCSLVDRSDSK